MAKQKKLPPKTARLRAPRNMLNGKPIVDAKRALVFSVTKADTKGAKQRNPEGCAAARAICREEGVVGAHVNRGIVLIEREKVVERYVTPRPLAVEITDFDRHGTTNYLEKDFRLLPPPRSKMLGSDHRPSTRGGGADKRRAGPVYPRYEVDGGRPRAPSNRF